MSAAAEQGEFDCRLILSLMDLTSLNESDTEADIAALAEQANTPLGAPAALCIYKQFLPAADAALRAQGLRSRVKLATVVNFPHGGEDSATAAAETAAATQLGADEIDIVIPYRAVQRNDDKSAAAVLRAARAACRGKILKVILESGALEEPAIIRRAAELAVAEGADFIKTSTGKVAVNATLPAAEIMLEVIKRHNPACGFKAAGGVRTAAQARQYLALAAQIMGADWINPAHFRFGASGLLADLLAAGEAAAAPAGGY